MFLAVLSPLMPPEYLAVAEDQVKLVFRIGALVEKVFVLRVCSWWILHAKFIGEHCDVQI
jgi:hypothetical protein